MSEIKWPKPDKPTTSVTFKDVPSEWAYVFNRLMSWTRSDGYQNLSKPEQRTRLLIEWTKKATEEIFGEGAAADWIEDYRKQQEQWAEIQKLGPGYQGGRHKLTPDGGE